jgi:hypothetical protein
MSPKLGRLQKQYSLSSSLPLSSPASSYSGGGGGGAATPGPASGPARAGGTPGPSSAGAAQPTAVAGMNGGAGSDGCCAAGGTANAVVSVGVPAGRAARFLLAGPARARGVGADADANGGWCDVTERIDSVGDGARSALRGGGGA